MDTAGSSSNAKDVFVYMGEGSNVPENVKHARIHPSVTVIPAGAFRNCTKLQTIDIPEGVVEIKDRAFSCCFILEDVIIPSTVKRIGDMAFSNARITTITLPEDLEAMGRGVFVGASPPSCFRVPPLITVLPSGVFYGCRYMFSLELPEGIGELGHQSLGNIDSLRNVAISPLSNMDWFTFDKCNDLKSVFGTSSQVRNAIQHRFDNLPIHKMLYYQSYNDVTVEQLNDATNMRSGIRPLRSKLDLSGNQQDTLGMTPLHILACSTVHDIDMYRIIVDNYPDNLITKDKWGALPILYAIWGRAPLDIVEFLVDNMLSIHPDHEFDSVKMFETLARTDSAWGADVQWELLDTFLHYVHDELRPELNTTSWWNMMLHKSAADSTSFDEPGISPTALQFLATHGLWRQLGLWSGLFVENVMEILDKAVEDVDRRTCLNELLSDLDRNEKEYLDMKYATSQLELALWNKKIEESVHVRKRPRKAKKYDASSFRKQCRVNCGASIVIPLVLPFLLPVRAFS